MCNHEGVSRITITHFSDPGCPFAYSALPALTALRWRYGDQLAWRHVLIGLTEERRAQGGGELRADGHVRGR